MSSNPKRIIKRLNIAKASLFAVTVALLVIFPHLPPRTLQLYPNANNTWGTYTDSEIGGNTSIGYIDEQRDHFECLVGDHAQYKMCGNTLMFFDNAEEAAKRPESELEARALLPTKTLDLSDYSGIWVDLDYRGPADQLVFMLVNSEPGRANSDPDSQSRFMYTHSYRNELNQKMFLDFNEFYVADWWRFRFRIHRSDAINRFDNIRGFAVEMKQDLPGTEHNLRMKSVYATGEWLSKEQLYAIVIIIWAIMLLSEGGLRIYFFYSYHKSVQRSLDALQNHYKQLKDQSYKDELTGVFNRTAIKEIIEATFKRGAAENLAVLVIDVDNFKIINDKYGHKVGDEVLQYIATTLKANTRNNDNLARWGGEEFIIITKQPSAKNTMLFAEKLRRALEVQLAYLPKHPNLAIQASVSIGFTLTHRKEQFDSAFERADQALYQAKANGRNCCRGL